MNAYIIGRAHWKIHDNPTTSTIAFGDIKEVLLAIEWNFFHL